MRNAQVASHVFTYILGLLIIGLIVIIGYMGINFLLSRARLVEVAKFKEDFRSLVYETRDLGEQRLFEVNLPTGFTAICFYDSDGTNNNNPPVQKPFVSALSNQNNVFLIRYRAPISAKAVEAFNVSKLFLNGNKYQCFYAPSSGIVRLKLTGKGKLGTEISAS